MARPRIHDPEAILDAAERLLADEGAGALTIRALAERTGAPSGTLYHAFGSRSDLLARLWVRAATGYLDQQQTAVDAALAADGPVAAVIAAAETLAVLRERRPTTARLLLRHRRQDLIGDDLSPALAAELDGLQRRLDGEIRRLALALWQRGDRAAREVVAACVVDLPGALLLDRRPRTIDPRPLLAAAVGGILAAGPPAPER
ncbi:TetR/AcrR family transcriptional regulator [Patulibacter defluvii]|uniref:TetR/AcrR family transcriptional regulator n=1 Tax=Patulibacter defluvii TaxID=3095358 RepID=UPI002A7620AE|nr:helix-turn-helix domain-containing protein [Patulibacter sp. DM4]